MVRRGGDIELNLFPEGIICDHHLNGWVEFHSAVLQFENFSFNIRVYYYRTAAWFSDKWWSFGTI